jgi:hypothetical protein
VPALPEGLHVSGARDHPSVPKKGKEKRHLSEGVGAIKKKEKIKNRKSIHQKNKQNYSLSILRFY